LPIGESNNAEVKIDESKVRRKFDYCDIVLTDEFGE